MIKFSFIFLVFPAGSQSRKEPPRVKPVVYGSSGTYGLRGSVRIAISLPDLVQGRHPGDKCIRLIADGALQHVAACNGVDRRGPAHQYVLAADHPGCKRYHTQVQYPKNLRP